MTFGIEIESESKYNSKEDFSIIKEILDNWNVTLDGSLINGIEVVSPILQGDEKTKEIYYILYLLKSMGQNVSHRCGGHIHIGADYLTSVESFQNLIELWGNSENLLYIICNEKGTIPRNQIDEYASPISKKIENALADKEIDLQSENDLNNFINKVNYIQRDRYSGINFQNLKPFGKKTIEFRLSNGSINPDTWIENINLFGGIIKASQELSIIQKKPKNERTSEEQKKLELFENIKNVKISQIDRLKSLLKLVLDNDYYSIYMDRYITNSNIIKDYPEMLKKINTNVSKNPILFNKKQIGELVFTGKKSINGNEYQQITRELNTYLNPKKDHLKSIFK